MTKLPPSMQKAAEKAKTYKYDKSKYAILNDGLVRVNLKENIVVKRAYLKTLLRENNSPEVKLFIKSLLNGEHRKETK